MTERDAQIIELTKQGLSARKIRERLGLSITPRSINRIQLKHLGTIPPNQNGRAYRITISFMPIVKEALRRLGKDGKTCEVCGDKPEGGCIIHHTKYEGCTIFDLMYVCYSCNLSRANLGLN